MKNFKYIAAMILIVSPRISFGSNPSIAIPTIAIHSADPDSKWAQNWREDRDLLRKFQKSDPQSAGKLQQLFESNPQRFRRIADGGFALTNHWLKMIRNSQASVFTDVQIYSIQLQHAAYGKNGMRKSQAEALIQRYSHWLRRHPAHSEAPIAQAEVEALKKAIAEGLAR